MMPVKILTAISFCAMNARTNIANTGKKCGTIIIQENYKMLYSGWEHFTPDTGTIDQMQCRACGELMLVERGINGPTGWAESIGGGKHLHDRFVCPNAGKDWHTQAIKIKKMISETPSARISEILTEEVNEILCHKRPTK
jgi:hypothetical protein